MMTACDLSGTVKDWSSTKKIVSNLSLELWEEGDQRRMLGLNLLPMMDSDKKEDMAENQVGFYTNIALKAFETLAKLIPSCAEFVDQGRSNITHWTSEADKVRQEKEGYKQKLLQEKRREEDLEREGLGLTVKGGFWKIEDSRTS